MSDTARRPRRPAVVDAPATLAVAASTAVTAISMQRVFVDWSYLPRMLVAALAIHALAVALRALRTPGWLAAPALATGAVGLLSALYYGASSFGPIPTATTIELARADIADVAGRFATAVAPVPSTGSFATAAAAAMVIAAVLADSFAFRAGGRSESLVPTAAIFVIVSVTGTDRHRLLYGAAWIAVALVAVALLRARQHRIDFTRMGTRRGTALGPAAAALSMAVVAASAGAWLAPRVPGAGGDPLVDTRTPVASVTQVISPLVDIKAQLRERSDTELFVAETPGSPRYWRLVSLPTFDGSAWNPPEEDLMSLDDAPPAPWAGSASVTFDQLLVIRGLGGPLVPSAYLPADVDTDDLDVYWAPDSESLVAPRGGLEAGDRLRITATAPVLRAEQLRATRARGAPARYTDLPPLPSVVGETAAAITASATSDFDRALALQAWFRSEFVYDTDVDFGNSASAIERFLVERRGFCQQFAGTFAVMTRTLGFPSRVAVGFTPGTLDSSGRYHVSGRDAHAWPEVWFEGLGWVAFEPTPGRGGGAGGDYLGIEPTTESTVSPGDTVADTSAPTTTLATPATSTTAPTSTPTSTVAGDDAATGQRYTTPVAQVLVALLAAIVLAGSWRLVVAPVVRRRRRAAIARRPPAQRIAAQWHRALRCAQVLGVDLDAADTPLEIARSSAGAVDGPTMQRLARLATRATFSADVTTDDEADTALALADSIEASTRAALTGAGRWRATIDPWFLATPRGVTRRSDA